MTFKCVCFFVYYSAGKAKFKKSLKNIAIPSTNLPLTYEVEERERASEDGLFEKEVHNEKEMEVAEGLIALFNNQTVYVGPKRIQNCESLREKNTECNTLPSKDPNPWNYIKLIRTVEKLLKYSESKNMGKGWEDCILTHILKIKFIEFLVIFIFYVRCVSYT